jgi:hypothetical protein
MERLVKMRIKKLNKEDILKGTTAAAQRMSSVDGVRNVPIDTGELISFHFREGAAFFMAFVYTKFLDRNKPKIFDLEDWDDNLTNNYKTAREQHKKRPDSGICNWQIEFQKTGSFFTNSYIGASSLSIGNYLHRIGFVQDMKTIDDVFIYLCAMANKK